MELQIPGNIRFTESSLHTMGLKSKKMRYFRKASLKASDIQNESESANQIFGISQVDGPGIFPLAAVVTSQNRKREVICIIVRCQRKVNPFLPSGCIGQNIGMILADPSIDCEESRQWLSHDENADEIWILPITRKKRSFPLSQFWRSEFPAAPR